uniref:C-type lectin domain-containing protein n=1 Tax=Esox lucius TaxID=8010 RepID=A0A3P8ZQL0_ESOLU
LLTPSQLNHVMVSVKICTISYCFTGPPEFNRGWHQFGSCCFRFEETLRSWTEAERHCQSLGGHLASVHIHSWLESIFLEALTIDLPLTWIGGTDGGQPQMTQVPRHTGVTKQYQ